MSYKKQNFNQLDIVNLVEVINHIEDGIVENENNIPLKYGVCDTAADVADKTVTVEGNFELKEGAFVIIRFINANSIASPTLNVNGTGAKPMYRYGTTTLSTGTTTTGWVAGAVQMFTYNGEGWIRDYWNNTTYSNASLGCGYATCSTAAATVAKTASLSSYSLTTGGMVAVKFINAVPANATLNINSKGAKNIFYRGVKIVANVIKSGDIATFIYDGTQYQLLSIDRWQNDINTLNEEIANQQTLLDSLAKQVSGVNYTNLLPLATNADGTPFVGSNGEKGYETEHRYSTSSGTVVSATGYCYTGFMPITKGATIRIKNITTGKAGSGSIMMFYSDKSATNRPPAFFEEYFDDCLVDGVYIITPDDYSSLNDSNIAFFTLSTGTITENTIITVNEEIVGNANEEEEEETTHVSAEEVPEVVIPSALYGVVGHEFVLYYDNILKCMIPEDFVVSTVFSDSSNSILNLKPQFDRMLKFTPTADHIGTHGITIKVMSRRTWETVATKESSIIISADTERIGRKVMFIGDSLTYASTYPAEIERMSNGGIVSVGTISHSISFNGGTATVLSEGRNSMASYDYVGRQTAHSYSNPFYNSNKEYSLTLDKKYTSATGYLTFDNSGSVSVLKHHFDFAYYMNNNNVGELDAVFINLGTNGGNGYALSDVYVAFDAMIERIRAYSATLPIFLHLFPPTSRAGNASRNSNGVRNVRIELDSRKGYYDCIQTLIDRYENDSRVTIVPTYTMLDTIYDYKRETVTVSARNDETVTIGQHDSTHPAKAGYLHMADSYYNVLQCKLDDTDTPEESVGGYVNLNSGEAGTVLAGGVASLDKCVYQNGYYISTSSPKALNTDANTTTFGMIEAKDGDTIYVKGVAIDVVSSATTAQTHARFGFAKWDGGNTTSVIAEHKFYNNSSTHVTLTCLDSATNYYSIKINSTGLNYNYVLFSLVTDSTGAEALIITKNQEITD